MLKKTPKLLYSKKAASCITLCLSCLFVAGCFTQLAQAISLGSDVHSQGATITKDYFIYTALDGSDHTDIFRCNRSGTDFDNCQVIVSGDFGHANVLDHEWGSNYFWVEGGGCYSLDGSEANSADCAAKPSNWTSDNAGLTGQGRTQYGNYRLNFGNTHNTHSRIVVKEKKNGRYETIKKIDINEKPVVLDDYSPEIEDVAVDGDTGEIYYTMSGWFDYQGGDQEVRLYKVSDYTLPASGSNNSLKSGTTGVCSNGLNLPNKEAAVFSQNNLSYWNPCECEPRGGGSSIISSNSCFKINDSIGVQDRWYAEGEIGAAYASVVYTSTYNDFLISDTKIDEDFGGLQYIYAENYDIEYGGYEGWIPKFTKKSDANSTRKYYWIVLPAESYSNGFGETYVATFENLSEPVYFITYDTHGTEAEVPARYKSEAEADPNGVAIAEEFFGALAKGGGNFTEAANKAGKLKSFCRINGQGEVLAASNGSASNITASSSGTTGSSTSSTSTSSSGTSLTAGTSPDLTTGSSSNSSGTVSGSDITWIGDSYSVGAHSIIEKTFPGISFGNGIENSNSYIQSNKGVSDRYGGGSSNPPALTILKRIVDANELKPYLVMAVGTNMGWDDDEVNEFKNIMSSHPDTKVVFVTAKAKAKLSAETDGTNERLKALADSNNNYYLADWAAAYDEKYFENNSTHPDANGGYEKWVEVIAAALNGSGDCSGGGSSTTDYPQYFQETGYTCGQSSMAMLATVAAGKEVTEADVIRITGGDGEAYANTIGSGMAALDKKVGDEYGFTVETVEVSGLSDAAAKMKEYLDKGYMIHMSGEGCTISPTCETHYVGIFKLDGDKALLADSSQLKNREVNLNDYIMSGYHGDAFSAIKGGGTKKCNNNNSDNYCPDGSGGSGSNESYNGTGLTDEQAEKLAANYNNNTDNWDSKAGAGLFCEGGSCASKYSNCSLMSAFFVEMFTSVGTGQAWSGMYGGNVVNVLSGMGFSTGSEPKAFSVFSCGPTDWGHTGVVVRVDGDSVTTVEAGYPNMIGQKANMSTCSGYGSATYAYLNDKMDVQKLMDFINK